MKKIKIGLLPRIIIAIILGIAIGTVFPAPLVRIFVTFNGIFSEFLNFSIPLIIVGLVTVAIADIGKGVFRFSLLFHRSHSIPITHRTGRAARRSKRSTRNSSLLLRLHSSADECNDRVNFRFYAGVGARLPEQRCAKKRGKGLPLYIFGIFLNMTHSGQVYAILMVFIKIIGVIFILHIFLLVFQYSIAALFVRKNPFKLLGKMMPAYFTALGTQSSAATIPVTLEQTKKNGVSSDIAGFVIPLCATIHLSGSTLKIVACALALMMMQGIPFDFPLFAGFIFMLGITMVAAPGVPGGAIMAALGILQSMLSFDESAQALMIALYIAMDSFGTACNVTGDGAIALIIDKIMGKNRAERLC